MTVECLTCPAELDVDCDLCRDGKGHGHLCPDCAADIAVLAYPLA